MTGCRVPDDLPRSTSQVDRVRPLTRNGPTINQLVIDADLRSGELLDALEQDNGQFAPCVALILGKVRHLLCHLIEEALPFFSVLD